jgi:Fe-S oxidoreductase
MRYLFWKRRDVLKDLPTALWSLYWNNNPWGQPPSQRMHWIGDREIPLYDADHHDILLYIGCTSSFDRRAQNIARSLVKVLGAAEIHFGILGEGEPCCGEAALSLGHRPYFEELADKAVSVFEEHQVKKIVTISPHCYDVMRNEYPEGVNFEILHYTQYLTKLIQDEVLTFQIPLDQKVTLQDPCFLGRRNGEYDAPREVIHAIPGISFIEMKSSGSDALCCGGGGGRMWMETPIGERFSDIRVQEAASISADIIATACPFCITCFEDSIKAEKIQDLQVMDIAELAARSIEGEI